MSIIITENLRIPRLILGCLIR